MFLIFLYCIKLHANIHSHCFPQLLKIFSFEAQQTDDKDISHIDDILSMDFESIYHTLEDTEKRYLWQSIIDHIDIGNNRNDITIYFK